MTVMVSMPAQHGHVRLQHPSRAYDHGRGVDYTVGLTSTAGRFRRPALVVPLPGLGAALVRSCICRGVGPGSAVPKAMAWSTA